MIQPRIRFALLAALLLTTAAVAEDEWPQFRGPGGQGISSAQGLPTTWSESSHIAWKTPLPGLGHSSPVVAHGQAWVTTALEDGHSLHILGVNVGDGKLICDVEVLRAAEPPHINAKNSHASPTPVLEGDLLYAHFGTSGTVCFSTGSRKIVWTNNDLHLDHQEGPGSSPILFKDFLILTCDGRDVQFVAALDKHTGKPVWKTARSAKQADTPDFRKAFATPLVIDVGGQPELISPAAQRIYAYDPRDGRELWQVTHPGFSNVPRPVFGHGLLYVSTGYMKPELWALRPGGKGDVTGSHIVWRETKQAPANPSPVLVGEELYAISDQGLLSCYDATSGKLVWRERLGGNFSSSLLFADGKLYVSSEEGKTIVFAPGKQFKLLAENVLDRRIMAAPAVVGRALLVRTDQALYRIEDSAAGASAAGK